MTLVTNGPANFVPYRWTYADAAARTGATDVAAADVGGLALQLDTGSLWRLTDDSPVTWQAIGGGAVAALDDVGDVNAATPSDGDVLTWDATPGEWVAAASGGGATFAGVSVTHNANQSIANNTAYITLAFNTENFDSDGFHDNATNNSRLTVPTGLGGVYLCSFLVDFPSDGSGTGQRYANVRKNGATVVINDVGFSEVGMDAVRISASLPIQLAAGDYVELRVFQNSGGALDCRSLSGVPIFSLVRWR
jgi:hypothetical protein